MHNFSKRMLFYIYEGVATLAAASPHVLGLLPGNNEFPGACGHGCPTRSRIQLALLLKADLLFGLGAAPECLRRPASGPGIKDVLHNKLDAFGVRCLALHSPPTLQVEQAAANLLHSLNTRGQRLQRVTHGKK